MAFWRGKRSPEHAQSAAPLLLLSEMRVPLSMRRVQPLFSRFLRRVPLSMRRARPPLLLTRDTPSSPPRVSNIFPTSCTRPGYSTDTSRLSRRRSGVAAPAWLPRAAILPLSNGNEEKARVRRLKPSPGPSPKAFPASQQPILQTLRFRQGYFLQRERERGCIVAPVGTCGLHMSASAHPGTCHVHLLHTRRRHFTNAGEREQHP